MQREEERNEATHRPWHERWVWCVRIDATLNNCVKFSGAGRTSSMMNPKEDGREKIRLRLPRKIQATCVTKSLPKICRQLTLRQSKTSSSDHRLIKSQQEPKEALVPLGNRQVVVYRFTPSSQRHLAVVQVIRLRHKLDRLWFERCDQSTIRKNNNQN